MAGAGYKLFNTGDVLTAAQVNTYLMEQTVMVFADAAARTAALSGVVSEGMISYLKDTNAVEVYNGSAWVASDDPNAIQNTIVDAKGDLISASAADTPARLAVGNNGETLVADSSASTGLRWQPDFSVGRNKIINGDFTINQRGFTSTTTTGVFMFDRFNSAISDGTCTYSAETFTPGTAPVTGYEATNFIRLVSSGQTASSAEMKLQHKIESVRTLANQTVTFSFWAKASTGTPSVAVELLQHFGSGGSATVTGIGASKSAITTSWSRYSFTITIPSISGKTLGAGNMLICNIYTSAGTDFNARTNSLGIQSATIDIWGVQLEAGNVATAFQTATGTLAGELAACQRYYARIGFPYVTNNAPGIAVGRSYSTTNGDAIIPLSVPLRAVATSVDYSGLQFNDQNNTTYALSAVSLNSNQQPNIGMITMTSTGMTANRMGWLIGSAGANTGYIGFSAEL